MAEVKIKKTKVAWGITGAGDKIAEIMGVDKDTARNYKAVLYKQVKDKDEESSAKDPKKPKLNGYERAIEMEKLATKEVLSKIDIKKKTEEIKKHLEEKASSKNTKKATNDSDSESGLSSTSSAQF